MSFSRRFFAALISLRSCPSALLLASRAFITKASNVDPDLLRFFPPRHSSSLFWHVSGDCWPECYSYVTADQGKITLPAGRI